MNPIVLISLMIGSTVLVIVMVIVLVIFLTDPVIAESRDLPALSSGETITPITIDTSTTITPGQTSLTSNKRLSNYYRGQYLNTYLDGFIPAPSDGTYNSKFSDCHFVGWTDCYDAIVEEQGGGTLVPLQTSNTWYLDKVKGTSDIYRLYTFTNSKKYYLSWQAGYYSDQRDSSGSGYIYTSDCVYKYGYASGCYDVTLLSATGQSAGNAPQYFQFIPITVGSGTVYKVRAVDADFVQLDRYLTWITGNTDCMNRQDCGSVVMVKSSQFNSDPVYWVISD